jgi:hypothetical protein
MKIKMTFTGNADEKRVPTATTAPAAANETISIEDADALAGISHGQGFVEAIRVIENMVSQCTSAEFKRIKITGEMPQVIINNLTYLQKQLASVRALINAAMTRKDGDDGVRISELMRGYAKSIVMTSKRLFIDGSDNSATAAVDAYNIAAGNPPEVITNYFDHLSKMTCRLGNHVGKDGKAEKEPKQLYVEYADVTQTAVSTYDSAFNFPTGFNITINLKNKGDFIRGAISLQMLFDALSVFSKSLLPGDVLILKISQFRKILLYAIFKTMYHATQFTILEAKNSDGRHYIRKMDEKIPINPKLPNCLSSHNDTIYYVCKWLESIIGEEYKKLAQTGTRGIYDGVGDQAERLGLNRNVLDIVARSFGISPSTLSGGGDIDAKLPEIIGSLLGNVGNLFGGGAGANGSGESGAPGAESGFSRPAGNPV